MREKQARSLALFLQGVLHVFLYIFLTSLLVMWSLQALAMPFGESFDWAAVFTHLFLSFSLLAFFPGQQVWTYRMYTRDGRSCVIVGVDNS